jgi:hypothetical protein
MFARSSVLGLLAVSLLSLSSDGPPSFSLKATGAVRLAVASDEASYGLTPERIRGRPVLAISLGAYRGEGSLSLFTQGSELPKTGRYPVLADWPDEFDGDRMFHACFIAGTVTRPVGAFHGESGWVNITSVEDGRIAGEFELRARGMLAADIANEDVWVTVRGSFVAAGDSTASRIESVAVAR